MEQFFVALCLAIYSTAVGRYILDGWFTNMLLQSSVCRFVQDKLIANIGFTTYLTAWGFLTLGVVKLYFRSRRRKAAAKAKNAPVIVHASDMKVAGDMNVQTPGINLKTKEVKLDISTLVINVQNMQKGGVMSQDGDKPVEVTTPEITSAVKPPVFAPVAKPDEPKINGSSWDKLSYREGGTISTAEKNKLAEDMMNNMSEEEMQQAVGTINVNVKRVKYSSDLQTYAFRIIEFLNSRARRDKNLTDFLGQLAFVADNKKAFAAAWLEKLLVQSL